METGLTGVSGTGDAGSATASGTGDATGTDGTSGGSTDSSTDSTTGPTTAGSDSAGSTGGGSTGGGDDGVCERWNADRADVSEGTWSGNVAGCDPGDISADGRANALKLINLYRFIADLPAVATDPTRDAKAQACALIMDAQGTLSHTPPMTWPCWSADGSEAAGSSNIAGYGGVAAVDLYMVDPGNPTTLGHRRWILSNSLGPTGLGSTGSASCMWTLYGNGNAGKAWMAWPPPGTFPHEAVAPSWTDIDETGWSIQSDTVDLSGAQVSITRNGQDLPVSVTQLQGGYGSDYAISMIPQGWTTDPGSYHVEVTGVSMAISYDVDVVVCQ